MAVFSLKKIVQTQLGRLNNSKDVLEGIFAFGLVIAAANDGVIDDNEIAEIEKAAMENSLIKVFFDDNVIHQIRLETQSKIMAAPKDQRMVMLRNEVTDCSTHPYESRQLIYACAYNTAVANDGEIDEKERAILDKGASYLNLPPGQKAEIEAEIDNGGAMSLNVDDF